MSIKTALTLMIAASMALGVGACKKNDPEPVAAPESSGNTIGTPAPSAAPPPAATGQVASYPNQVNMGSLTRQTLQPFTVKQAADNSSATIGHVSVGTWINIKASYSNWFLVEFPTGVGQLSPGWIELRGGVSDPRLNQNTTPAPLTVDAGVAAVPAVPAGPVPAVPTVAVPAVPAAPAAVDAGVVKPGRPALGLKPRGK